MNLRNRSRVVCPFRMNRTESPTQGRYIMKDDRTEHVATTYTCCVGEYCAGWRYYPGQKEEAYCGMVPMGPPGLNDVT
jgi:hypothetical protein